MAKAPDSRRQPAALGLPRAATSKDAFAQLAGPHCGETRPARVTSRQPTQSGDCATTLRNSEKVPEAGCKVQHALQQSVVACLRGVCIRVRCASAVTQAKLRTGDWGPVPTRRLMYCPLSESRSLYRPKHAAPSLLLRLVRQLSLALVWTHQLVGYYPPARHRRRPTLVLSQRPWLATAAVSAPYRLSPYPVFVTGQVRADRRIVHARA